MKNDFAQLKSQNRNFFEQNQKLNTEVEQLREENKKLKESNMVMNVAAEEFQPSNNNRKGRRAARREVKAKQTQNAQNEESKIPPIISPTNIPEEEKKEEITKFFRFKHDYKIIRDKLTEKGINYSTEAKDDQQCFEIGVSETDFIKARYVI